MGILRRASGETKQIDLGEGDFITVVVDLSRKQFNGLAASMPNREIADGSTVTLAEGLDLQEALFKALVKGWSLQDEPTYENYLELVPEAASAIDEKLIEHFNTLTPSQDETSKVSTSRARRQKA